MVDYALDKQNVHTIIAVYECSLWCYVFFSSRTTFDKAKKKTFFFVEDINLPKWYVEGGWRNFRGQILYDNQYKQGIQKEKKIHPQQQTDYTS